MDTPTSQTAAITTSRPSLRSEAGYGASSRPRALSAWIGALTLGSIMPLGLPPKPKMADNSKVAEVSWLLSFHGRREYRQNPRRNGWPGFAFQVSGKFGERTPRSLLVAISLTSKTGKARPFW